MTAAWMVYAVLVASLVALATIAVDRVFAIWRLPRRYLWLTAMVVATVAPFIAATRDVPTPLPSRQIERPLVGTTSLPRAAASVTPTRTALTTRVMRVLSRADRPARILWMATSAIAAVVLLGAFVTIRMRRASWKPATVDGHSAWIARDVGPAVVGLMRPRIVLPEWALQLGDTDRGLVLRHESEHIRAGDPLLLLAASLLLVAMPWNPALWWMTRRMRLAMEIDCDARVLRGTDAIHQYGMLLLAVTERRGHTLPLVASLTEQRGLLERRILAMTAPRHSYPRLVSAALALVACAATIAAAQAPVPQRSEGGGGSASPSDTIGRQTVAQIAKLVSDHHPAVDKGTSPHNRITFVLDARGNYVSSSAYTDSAPLRFPPSGGSAQMSEGKRSYESLRMIIGAGVRGGPGRTLPSGTQSGATHDYADYGFPKITSDQVAGTQAVMSRAPSALSVLVIRLK